MPKRNPYEPLSPKEILDKQKELKAIQTKTKEVAKLASECLSDPKFKKYSEEFEKFRNDVFEKLQYPIDPDPIKDAHYLRACINTILVLNMLLEKPKADVKKGGS